MAKKERTSILYYAVATKHNAGAVGQGKMYKYKRVSTCPPHDVFKVRHVQIQMFVIKGVHNGNLDGGLQGDEIWRWIQFSEDPMDPPFTSHAAHCVCFAKSNLLS